MFEIATPDISSATLMSELSTTLERVHRIADYARRREPAIASAEASSALSHAADLLTIAFSEFETCPSPAVKRLRAKGGLAGWQIRALRSHILEHIGDRIVIAELANVARISGSYLCRAFQMTFGCSPGQYIRNERLAFAKQQLRLTEFGLSEIAYSCGFADQPHFTRVFRTEVGMTPRAWRMASRHCADLPVRSEPRTERHE